MYLEQFVNILNKDEWQLGNPDWVKQRHKDWKNLSKTLREMGSFAPKDVRYYKSYYLTGELPEIKDELKDLPEQADCTILLFLHPLQTEANIAGLYQRFSQLRDEANQKKEANNSDYRRFDLDFFFHWILSKQDDFLIANGHGVLHDLEEAYCRLLYGVSKQEWAEVLRGRSKLFGAFCSANIQFLLKPDLYINYHYQYLAKPAFYMAPKLDYTFGRTSVEVNQFLQIIHNYEELDPFKGVDEERYQRAWKLVKATRDKLNTAELPEPLQQMWDFARTPEGKVAEHSSYPKKFPILKTLI